MAGVEQSKLAIKAGISISVLQKIGLSVLPDASLVNDVRTVKDALEQFGIRFIPENGGGLGVRLKFTVSDVRRIATLEDEGGIVGDDDI